MKEDINQWNEQIIPHYVIGFKQKPNRKLIKNEAIKLANTDRGDFATSNDYLAGNVTIDSNKRHQRLFNRTFNKKYRDRINKTIDYNLLESAKEGDSKAFEQYTARKTNEVAPYFIPAVAAPAAAIAATTGMLGMTGMSTAKGIDAVGKMMLPSTYLKAVKLVKGGQLLPQILDTGALAAYTTQGYRHAKNLWNNEEYEAAIATGALNSLPFFSYAKNGIKMLNNKFNYKPTSYSTVEEKIGNNKYFKALFNTRKARNDLYNRVQRLNRINSENTTKGFKDYYELNDELTKNWIIDDAVAKFPMEKISQNPKPYKNIRTNQITLPIDGINTKINTSTIDEGIGSSKIEIFNPNSKDSFVKSFPLKRPEVLLSRANQTGGMHVSRPGVPQPAEIDAFNKYRNSIQSVIGKDGAITGSSRLYGNHISGKPNDLEILTTKSRLGDLQRKLKFGRQRQLPLAIEGRSLINGSEFATDIQVIDETMGYATGDIANSLYTVLHPEKLVELHNINTGSDKLFYFKPNGQFYKPEELLDEVISKGLLDRVILVDALKVGKAYNMNPVKQNRPITLLSNDNPRTIKEIKEVLNLLGKSQVGKEYKSFSDLYNVDFNNVSANKAFLKGIGFPEELATNPEIMKNIAEYYHMQKSLSIRNINSNRLYGSLTDAITTTTAGATASGGGGNSVNATHGRNVTAYGDISTISQYDLIPDKTKVKTLEDFYNQIQRLDRNTLLTKEQLNKIIANPNYAYGNYKTVRDVHTKSGNINTKENAEFVSKELDLPVIFSPNEAVSNYVGRYAKAPITYATKNSKSAPFEFGRPLENYYINSQGLEVPRTQYKDVTEKDFVEKIIKLIENNDKVGLQELGIKIYTKQDLDELQQMLNRRDAKNYRKIHTIYKKHIDKLHKIEDIKTGIAQAGFYGVGMSSIAGGLIYGTNRYYRHKTDKNNKNKQYLEDKEFIYQYYKDHPNDREIYKKQLSKKLIQEFEKRLEDETKAN